MKLGESWKKLKAALAYYIERAIDEARAVTLFPPYLKQVRIFRILQMGAASN